MKLADGYQLRCQLSGCEASVIGSWGFWIVTKWVQYMDKNEIAMLKRIFGLTVVKDNEEDTPYDSLVKIADLARTLLCRHDVDFAYMVAQYEYQKRKLIEDDEHERLKLWQERK